MAPLRVAPASAAPASSDREPGIEASIRHAAAWTRRAATALALLALAAIACARPFPRPPDEAADPGARAEGTRIFAETFAAHGGERLATLSDAALALEGEWPFWLPRIQPLVTDHRYRVASEERILVETGVYAADYLGPAGTKRVLRTRDAVRVVYDGEESGDPEVLETTAMTADSYLYFLLGPLFLADRAGDFVRLSDAEEAGRRYARIHAVLEPGVGISERDEIVLWVDAETRLTFRVHFTIDGTRATRGAHVDTTFLEYRELGGFVFPTRFHERVRAPFAIDAHTWWLTGLELDRGLSVEDLDPMGWSARARAPAAPLSAAPPPAPR